MADDARTIQQRYFRHQSAVTGKERRYLPLCADGFIVHPVRSVVYDGRVCLAKDRRRVRFVNGVIAMKAPSLLLDVNEMAELLGCSTRSIRRMLKSGQIPAPVRLRGMVRWNREQVLRWIEAGCPKEGGR